MPAPQIALRRFAAQSITPTACSRPEDVVARLCAVQAQDYLGALWAVGLRLPDATEAGVEEALADRRIVRSWPMRGTLHFVAAEDARWITHLLAPKILAATAGRLRQLGIDAPLISRTRRVLEKALGDGGVLTRPATYACLERAKIATADGRGLQLLWVLAQEGVVCFGPRQGKQQTFVLLEDWVPNAKRLVREEGLARLAHRYVAGHGPATTADFAWWSGLRKTEAGTALEAARGPIDIEETDGTRYWVDAAGTPSRPRHGRLPAHALPAFDEFFVGYADRSSALDPGHTKTLDAFDVLRPTLVSGGLLAGNWQRRLERGGLRFQTRLFKRTTPEERTIMGRAFGRYARFLGFQPGQWDVEWT